MGTGNRERIVWRSCGLLSLLLVPCRVAVGDPSRAQPSPPDTGRLEIEGPTIERLTLRKFGPPPYNDSLVFDHPGPVVSLQMGDYLVDRIELKGGYYCYGGPMLTIRDKPYRLKIGGPLKPTVSTTRGGRYIGLSYELRDAEGHTYGRQNVEGSAGRPPRFTVYLGDRVVGSGAFEYG